ncbi:hypothetical protein D3C81_1636400 [compost metagenome]
MILGVIERRRREGDFGGDVAVAGRMQLLLIGIAAGQHGVQLRLCVAINGRAVLGAGVVALTHALGRVMVLPERAQHGLQRDLRRVEHHPHHFGMAGEPGADFLVARVRRDAALVAHRCGHHARQLPELALGAPETPHANVQHLQPGEITAQRLAIDEMHVVQRQRRIAPRQRFFRAWQALLERADAQQPLADSQHDQLLTERVCDAALRFCP